VTGLSSKIRNGPMRRENPRGERNRLEVEG
jgi:hypothetical protein